MNTLWTNVSCSLRWKAHAVTPPDAGAYDPTFDLSAPSVIALFRKRNELSWLTDLRQEALKNFEACLPDPHVNGNELRLIIRLE